MSRNRNFKNTYLVRSNKIKTLKMFEKSNEQKEDEEIEKVPSLMYGYNGSKLDQNPYMHKVGHFFGHRLS